MIPTVGDLLAVLVVLILLAVATVAMHRRRAASIAEFKRKREARARENLAQDGDL